jgi:polysaccharide export outer membrane protein
MKPGSILLVAFLAPSLFCLAQDKAPAAQDTAKPAAQETAKPVAPDAAKPAAQDSAKFAAPDAAKVAATDSYVIGATDVLAVSVFKEPTLSNTMLVRPDGMISMPLLGDVQASGKTPLQLADEITAKLKKYVQDPNVTVILNQMNSKKVYLMGEIGHTGPIEMTPGMTLLQAIATGGGLNPFANAKKIYILRIEAGKQQKIPVQYKQALKGDLSLNLILNPGDTIVVP